MMAKLTLEFCAWISFAILSKVSPALQDSSFGRAFRLNGIITKEIDHDFEFNQMEWIQQIH